MDRNTTPGGKKWHGTPRKVLLGRPPVLSDSIYTTPSPSHYHTKGQKKEDHPTLKKSIEISRSADTSFEVRSPANASIENQTPKHINKSSRSLSKLPGAARSSSATHHVHTRPRAMPLKPKKRSLLCPSTDEPEPKLAPLEQQEPISNTIYVDILDKIIDKANKIEKHTKPNEPHLFPGSSTPWNNSNRCDLYRFLTENDLKNRWFGFSDFVGRRNGRSSPADLYSDKKYASDPVQDDLRSKINKQNSQDDKEDE